MNTSRRLYRSNRDKMIGGVAGGIAEYFNVDTTLIRLIFVLLFFFTGIGIVPYLIMWVVIPEEPSLDDGLVYDQKRKREESE